MTAMVAADECDPKVMTTTFYDDDKCTKENAELNKQYGTVPESAYGYYTSGCHQYQVNSYTLECDAQGSHQTLYKDQECKEVDDKKFGGKSEYAWDTCEKAVGANLWIKIHSEQSFEKAQ